MEYKNYFRIADICIEVSSPFPFATENGNDFLCAEAEPDYRFSFKETESIPDILEGAAFVANLRWAHEYQTASGEYRRAFLWNEYYDAVTIIKEKTGVCYYASFKTLYDKIANGFEFFNYLCLEQILLQFGALVLHSSHIKTGGKGIVFSAPSQTGKSTQAELWRKYAGAEIINGDRSILRKQEGVWQVCGCPMCGTSQIHKPGKEPLMHIVMLAQGPDNEIRRINGIEAFQNIYSQITVAPWRNEEIDLIFELLDDLLQNVPVWMYSCTKEPEAVWTLKKVLLEEEI